MKLRRNRPVITESPHLVVDGNLPPGTYIFQLEVIDSHGQISQAALARVQIHKSFHRPSRFRIHSLRTRF